MLVELFFRLVFENHVLINPATIYSAVSVLDCARLCQFPCSSFFYNQAQHQCVLSNILYEETHPTIESTIGWKYFSFTGDDRCVLDYGYTSLSEVGLCVKVYREVLSQTDAHDRCESDGGRLVVLEDEDKGDAVLNLLVELELSAASFFIGLTRDPTDSSNYIWEDGRSLSRDWWMDGEPNGALISEHCAGIYKGDLADMPCVFVLIDGFICEIH